MGQIEHGGELIAAIISEKRIVIDNISPIVGGGRYPVKRVKGEPLCIEADILVDGFASLAAEAVVIKGGQEIICEPMLPIGNDGWKVCVCLLEAGVYSYTLRAWIDPFRTWQTSMIKGLRAGKGLCNKDIQTGVSLLAQMQSSDHLHEDQAIISKWHDLLTNDSNISLDTIEGKWLGDELNKFLYRCSPRMHLINNQPALPLWVDAKQAAFSTWYQAFPRSFSSQPGSHGTLLDFVKQLPRIAELGFDVIYFPCIHPIGMTNRKGCNNALHAASGEPGSPWGVGSNEGGHKHIHPQLGTFGDFYTLLQDARALGIEIALDLAFHCSPDHPYVSDHPEWFKREPDGSIQCAEDPPNTYEDVYPFDVYCENRESLWHELLSIVEFWISRGIKIFRVDNPHSKPFPFWEWMLQSIKDRHPEIIFLSEGLTRPKLMHELAKIGFTQSYDYFPWKNSKQEIVEYYQESTSKNVREYFRPVLWTNTPQHLPVYLQHHGRNGFIARLILAATLGSSYGIYGPAFELCVARACGPESVDYLDSEQYELIRWDLHKPGNISEVIRKVNGIRRQNTALHSNAALWFHQINNDKLVAYSKISPDHENRILVVVNIDSITTQAGEIELSLDRLGFPWSGDFIVHDLLSSERYQWHGARNYVELTPGLKQAHIFRIE